MDADAIRRAVAEVYDRTGREGSRGPAGMDLPTGAALARELGYPGPDLAGVPGEILDAFVGVATLAPEVGDPGAVADLGCGAGLDAWVLAARGHRVVALDASRAMLARLRRCLARCPGLPLHGVLAELPRVPLRDGCVDWVLMNGAANLVPDRPRLLAEALRVLRPGGRLRIGDLVALEPLPAELRDLPEAWAWCLGGAAGPDEWERTLRQAGFAEPAVEILEPAAPAARAVIRARRPVRAAG